MKKMFFLIWIFGVTNIVSADYSYQNSSVCVWDMCSVETCHVTEHDSEIITTTTEYTDEEISSALHAYLLKQGETTFANRLSWTVCMSSETYIETESNEITPDPTVVCEWTNPLCWNSEVDTQQGEECDKWIENNWIEWSWCSSSCTITPYCWDSVVNEELDEECDPWYDAAYCNENTCKLLDDVPVWFDIWLFDPTYCEWNFMWGIETSEENFDFSQVWMYLEAKCPWSDVYVPLNPEIDDNWEYVAEIEYSDLSSPRFLVWECHIRYWWWYISDDTVIHKTAFETLEGMCPTWSWNWSWWSWSSGWSGSWPSSAHFSSYYSTPAIPLYSSFYERIDADDVMHNSAPVQASKLQLDPWVPLNFPSVLNETWGFMFDF